MMKVLKKPRTEGTYLNILKIVYNKPSTNIVSNGEKKVLTSKIRNETRMSTLFNIVLEFLEQ
jgi:hypothetical protein